MLFYSNSDNCDNSCNNSDGHRYIGNGCYMEKVMWYSLHVLVFSYLFNTLCFLSMFIYTDSLSTNIENWDWERVKETTIEPTKQKTDIGLHSVFNTARTACVRISTSPPSIYLANVETQTHINTHSKIQFKTSLSPLSE